MLHVISAGCVARGLHTIVPGLVGDSSRRCEEIVKNLDLHLSKRVVVVVVVVVVAVAVAVAAAAVAAVAAAAVVVVRGRTHF